MTNEVIRQARGAGRWFPGQREELRRMVDGYIAAASAVTLTGPIVGAIAPHAGYVYSGPVAGHTFGALSTARDRFGAPDAVIVLGFCHRPSASGVALLDGTGLETPLGIARLDTDLTRELTDEADCIFCDAAPHAGEHSAENQVPFLQVALPDTPLVIGLMGDHRPETVDALARALVNAARQRTIVVLASTDLLHDPDYQRVTTTDRETLATIAELDADGLRRRWSYEEQVCCGIGPVLTTMEFSLAQGCSRGTVLHYRNSGDDYPESRGSWVVGYGAAVFTPTA